MGQERLGGDLAIAVDPHNSSTVWVAWCDRVGGADRDRLDAARPPVDRPGADVVEDDLRTIKNAKNPCARGQLEQRARAAVPGVHRHALGDDARADDQRLGDGRDDDRAAHGAVGDAGADVLPVHRRLRPDDRGRDELLRRVLREQHPGQRELPERGHLPANANWTAKTLLDLDNVHAVALLDRSVLLPVHAEGHRARRSNPRTRRASRGLGRAWRRRVRGRASRRRRRRRSVCRCEGTGECRCDEGRLGRVREGPAARAGDTPCAEKGSTKLTAGTSGGARLFALGPDTPSIGARPGRSGSRYALGPRDRRLLHRAAARLLALGQEMALGGMRSPVPPARPILRPRLSLGQLNKSALATKAGAALAAPDQGAPPPSTGRPGAR